MRRSAFSLVLFGIVAVGVIGEREACARQWKVTLTRIVVEPAKASGEPWDGDGSAPDIVGKFGAARVEGNRCPAPPSRELMKRQDTFEVVLNAPIVVEADAPTDVCFAAKLSDKDLVDDDMIGVVAVRLRRPVQEIQAGQATLTVTLAPVGGGPPPSTAHLATPEAHPEGLYRVSIVSASVAPSKPDGTSWDPADDPEAESSAQLMSLVKLGLMFSPAGATAQILGAAASMGQAAAPKGTTFNGLTRAAPDTRVSLQWGDLTFDSPVHRNTYSPAWRTQFLVSKDVFESAPMRVEAIDDDDGSDDHIGTQLVSPAGLLAGSVVRLKVGSVTELVLQVERVREAEAPLEKTVSITGSKEWLDTGIVVLGGQTIQVVASGESCIRGSQCFDAAGDTDKPVTVGALTVNTGQLAAIVGDDIYPVGTAGSFVVRSGGRLGLGIARGEVSSGGFEATARVFYPVATTGQHSTSPTQRP